MMMAFGIAVVLVSMMHLFTVTWAAQNAHMRAREAVFHGTAYQRGVRTSYVSTVSTPFDVGARNYKRADPNASINFSARAWDTTRDDLIGSENLSVRNVIQE